MTVENLFSCPNVENCYISILSDKTVEYRYNTKTDNGVLSTFMCYRHIHGCKNIGTDTWWNDTPVIKPLTKG